MTTSSEPEEDGFPVSEESTALRPSVMLTNSLFSGKKPNLWKKQWAMFITSVGKTAREVEYLLNLTLQDIEADTSFKQMVEKITGVPTTSPASFAIAVEMMLRQGLGPHYNAVSKDTSFDLVTSLKKYLTWLLSTMDANHVKFLQLAISTASTNSLEYPLCASVIYFIAGYHPKKQRKRAGNYEKMVMKSNETVQDMDYHRRVCCSVNLYFKTLFSTGEEESEILKVLRKKGPLSMVQMKSIMLEVDRQPRLEEFLPILNAKEIEIKSHFDDYADRKFSNVGRKFRRHLGLPAEYSDATTPFVTGTVRPKLGENSNGLAFSTNSFFSPDLTEALLEYYKNSETSTAPRFAKHPTKCSYVRLVCAGKGSTAMRFQTSYKVESQLANMVDRFKINLAGCAMEAVIATINSAIKEAGHPWRMVSQRPNCAHDFVGYGNHGVYPPHSDAIAIATSKSSIGMNVKFSDFFYSTENKNCVPTMHCMMVLTSFISVCPDVVAKLGFSTCPNKLDLHGPGLHFMGALQGIKHDSTPVGYDILRLVTSYRYYLTDKDPDYLKRVQEDNLPTRSQVGENKYTCVLRGTDAVVINTTDGDVSNVQEDNDCEIDDCSDDDEIDGTVIPTEQMKEVELWYQEQANFDDRQLIVSYSDGFNKLKRCDYLALYDQTYKVELFGNLVEMPVLFKQDARIALKDQELYRQIMHHDFQAEMLLKHDIIFYVVFTGKQGKPERLSLLHTAENRLHIPGDRVSRGSVGTISSGQRNTIVIDEFGIIRCIVMARCYKNIPETIDNSMKGNGIWLDEYATHMKETGISDPSLLKDGLYTVAFDGCIGMCDSGGSRTNSGARAPQAKKMKTTDAAVTADKAQDYESHQTGLLFQAAGEGHILAIFRRIATWMATSNKESVEEMDDELYFHLYGHIKEIKFCELGDDAIELRFSSVEGFAKYFRENLDQFTYLRSFHFELIIAPSFQAPHYRRIAEKQFNPQNFHQIGINSKFSTDVSVPLVKESTTNRFQTSHDIRRLFAQSDFWQTTLAKKLSTEEESQVSTLMKGGFKACTTVCGGTIGTELVTANLVRLYNRMQVLCSIKHELRNLTQNEFAMPNDLNWSTSYLSPITPWNTCQAELTSLQQQLQDYARLAKQQMRNSIVAFKQNYELVSAQTQLTSLHCQSLHDLCKSYLHRQTTNDYSRLDPHHLVRYVLESNSLQLLEPCSIEIGEYESVYAQVMGAPLPVGSVFLPDVTEFLTCLPEIFVKPLMSIQEKYTTRTAFQSNLNYTSALNTAVNTTTLEDDDFDLGFEPETQDQSEPVTMGINNSPTAQQPSSHCVTPGVTVNVSPHPIKTFLPSGGSTTTSNSDSDDEPISPYRNSNNRPIIENPLDDTSNSESESELTYMYGTRNNRQVIQTASNQAPPLRGKTYDPAAISQGKCYNDSDLNLNRTILQSEVVTTVSEEDDDEIDLDDDFEDMTVIGKMTDKDNKTYLTTVSECVTILMFTFAACAIRAIRKGGLEEDVTSQEATARAIPITTKPKGLAQYIPNVLKRSPTPVPCRAMDVGCNYIRTTCTSFDDTLSETSLYDANYMASGLENRKMILDIIFKSTVYRLTGRAARFDEFLDYRRALHPERSFDKGDAIPSLFDESSRLDFFNFIRLYTIDTSGCMKRDLGGRQHPAHIPDRLKVYREFKSFLESFVILCEETLKNKTAWFLQQDVGSFSTFSRYDAVTGLSKAFSSLLEGTTLQVDKKMKKQFNFLSHQIIADLEELVKLPFGDVTLNSVFSGSGGCHGGKLFKHLDASKKGTNLWRAHQELTCHLKTLSKLELLALGLIKRKRKSDSTKVILWKLHGRAYCLTDTEHLLCKLSIICKNNHTSRNTSLCPIAFRTDCWPRYTKQFFERSVYNDEHATIMNGFKETLKAFQKLLTVKNPDGTYRMLPPKHIIFHDEAQYWFR